MKDSMSNIDIRLILPEIREAGEGAFIKNVYQFGNVFVLKLYQPSGGTTQLLIEPGRRVHLTDFRRVPPRMPPKFCSVLRKYIRDRRILSVHQHDFDRIIVFEVGDENESHKLVAELFGSGNLLLLNPDDSIFVAKHYKKMRDRDIVPKAEYEFPPPRGKDILSEDAISVKSIMDDSKANVVRTLASRLNLDAISCEEICKLAGINPTLKASELDDQVIADLDMGVKEFISRLRRGVKEPLIILEESDEQEEEKVAFVPFDFALYNEFESEEFDTFSRAIDEYYGVPERELEEQKEKSGFEKERERLQRIVDKQRESIDRLERKAEEMQKKGDLIYSHFQTVQEVLDTVTAARTNGRSWSEIMKRIEEGKKEGNESAMMIQSILPSQAEIVIQLGDVDVGLDIRLSAQDNAAKAYEQSKKSRSKIKGAKTQIEKTKTKLESLEESYVEPETTIEPVRIRKKKWYEKYRWFKSSEGYLILGGRDARTNERLAKRHMNANDVFLHASIHGAPYVIVKVPDTEPGETTLEEAAQFAVTFSRAWQDGFTSGDAFWLNPEQVSFTPPSGEYLPSGAVMLYGTKNYIRNQPVELAVGVFFDEDYAIPMSGPLPAIEKHCESFVRVGPGNEKKGDLIKEIMVRLKSKLSDEKAQMVANITQEELMRVLPPGNGQLLDD